MSGNYIVYGATGSGSVAIEAALRLIGLPYRVEDHAPWESAAQARALTGINPLLQVPALALPSGEMMTESAAILIWLADAYPTAKLAPAPSDAMRSGAVEARLELPMPKRGEGAITIAIAIVIALGILAAIELPRLQ